jgi:hypothetical protein
MITPAKSIARCATLDSPVFTLLERPSLSCISKPNAVHLAVQGLHKCNGRGGVISSGRLVIARSMGMHKSHVCLVIFDSDYVCL